MTKVRVQELAKELGMDNKELLDIVQKKDADVKNGTGMIEERIQRKNRMEKRERRQRRKIWLL